MDTTIFSKETQHQAAAFDQIGETYEQVFGTNETQVAAVEWLIKQLPQQARILDVGCGSGVPTAKMLTAAGFEVLGLDISPEMLKIAKRQVPLGNFQLMDIAEANLAGEKFQAIVAFFSLLMLRKSAFVTTLNKFRQSLQSEGYFVLSMVEGDMDYVEVPFLETTLHLSSYPQETLEKMLLAADLKILDVKTVDFVPAPGAPPEKQLFFFCQADH